MSVTNPADKFNTDNNNQESAMSGINTDNTAGLNTSKESAMSANNPANLNTSKESMSMKIKSAESFSTPKTKVSNVSKMPAHFLSMGINLFPAGEFVLAEEVRKISKDSKVKVSLTKKIMKEMISQGAKFYGKVYCRNQIQGVEKCLLSFNQSMGAKEGFEAWSPTVEGKVDEIYAKDFAALYANYLCKEIGKNKEMIADSLSLKFSGERNQILVATGKYSEVSYDMETRELKSRGTAVRFFSKMISGTEIFDGNDLGFLMFLGLAAGTLQFTELQRGASNLFERPFHYGGVEETSSRKIISDDLLMPIHFEGMNKFPYVRPVNKNLEGREVYAFVKKHNTAITFGKVGEWLGMERAANAMLIFKNDEYIYLTPDPEKAAKIFNRGTQSWNIPSANTVGKEKSNLAIQLKDGSYSIPTGKKVFTILTNGIGVYGSGPCFTNVKFATEVKKKEIFKISFDLLKGEVQEQLLEACGSIGEAIKFLVGKLQERVDAAVGRYVEEGDEVIPLPPNYNTKLIWNKMNQPIEIVGGQVYLDFQGDSISELITLEIDYLLCTKGHMAKVRAPYVKSTSIPISDYQFIDENGKNLWEEEAFEINFEANKGDVINPAFFFFCNEQPEECELISDPTPILLVGDREVDLLDPNNEVKKWIEERVKIGHRVYKVAKTYWEDVLSKQLTGAYPMENRAFDKTEYFQTSVISPDFEVMEEGSDYVLIKERVQYITGYHHYEVEISTAEENSTDGRMTIEMLSALYSVCPNWAMEVWEEASSQRKSVVSLVRMFSFKGGALTEYGEVLLDPNNEDSGVPVVDILSPEGRAFIREEIALTMEEEGLEIKNHRDVLNVYKATFPLGLVLTLGHGHWIDNKAMYLEFETLAVFSGLKGGVTTERFIDVIGLLHKLAVDKTVGKFSIDTQFRTRFNHSKEGLKAWISSLITSRKIFKRLSSSSKVLLGTKVRTSANPIFNQKKDELPVAVLHKDCSVVKRFKLKTGDIAAAYRIPMIFPGLVKVVITDDYSIASPAHTALRPDVWAMFNEGDSDGDGVYLLKAPSWLTEEEATQLNKHFFSMASYSYVYGENPKAWPCADFVSVKDKWSKKNLKKAGSFFNSLKISTFLNYREAVANHYSYNVGVGYGIAAVLVYASALSVHVNENNDVLREAIEEATSIAWRLLYEGFGLAGYTPQAAELFDLIRTVGMGVFTGEESRFIETADGKITYYSEDKSKEEGAKVKQGKTELCRILSEASDLTVSELDYLVYLLCTAYAYYKVRGAYERNVNWVKRALNSTGVLGFHNLTAEENAIILTTLRILGQGKDEALTKGLTEVVYSEELGMDEREEFSVMEAFRVLCNRKANEGVDLIESIPTPFIREALQYSYLVYDKTYQIILNQKLAEEAEDYSF